MFGGTSVHTRPPWDPQALGMQGRGMESRCGGLLHGLASSYKDTSNYRQPVLRSLTAPGHSPAAAEEPTLRKGASAENLDALVLTAGSCYCPLGAMGSTGSKWILMRLQTRLPATECAAQILTS